MDQSPSRTLLESLPSNFVSDDKVIYRCFGKNCHRRIFDNYVSLLHHQKIHDSLPVGFTLCYTDSQCECSRCHDNIKIEQCLHHVQYHDNVPRGFKETSQGDLGRYVCLSCFRHVATELCQNHYQYHQNCPKDFEIDVNDETMTSYFCRLCQHKKCVLLVDCQKHSDLHKTCPPNIIIHYLNYVCSFCHYVFKDNSIQGLLRHDRWHYEIPRHFKCGTRCHSHLDNHEYGYECVMCHNYRLDNYENHAISHYIPIYWTDNHQCSRCHEIYHDHTSYMNHIPSKHLDSYKKERKFQLLMMVFGQHDRVGHDSPIRLVDFRVIGPKLYYNLSHM